MRLAAITAGVLLLGGAVTAALVAHGLSGVAVRCLLWAVAVLLVLYAACVAAVAFDWEDADDRGDLGGN